MVGILGCRAYPVKANWVKTLAGFQEFAYNARSLGFQGFNFRTRIMYAIIETGGKQYRVAEGQKLSVEKLAVEEGKTVDFDQVLMVGEGENVKVGTPLLTGAKVVAEVIKHGRGKKIRILKFRRRSIT